MSHWNKNPCPKGGHYVDNQAYCHSCGAQQVPDTIVILLDGIDGDFIHAFSTLENALEHIRKFSHMPFKIIPNAPLDEEEIPPPYNGE